jgi:hypothetical protein
MPLAPPLLTRGTMDAMVMMTGACDTPSMFFFRLFRCTNYLQVHYVLGTTMMVPPPLPTPEMMDATWMTMMVLETHQVCFFSSVFFNVLINIYSYTMCSGTEMTTMMPPSLPTPEPSMPR